MILLSLDFPHIKVSHCHILVLDLHPPVEVHPVLKHLLRLEKITYANSVLGGFFP